MAHLARGIVWRSGSAVFRLAEDGTFADDHDATVTLGQDAEITVAHPVDLHEAQIARFRALFADYEVVPPIDQLGRAVHRPPAEGGASMTVSIDPTSHELMYRRMVERGFVCDGAFRTEKGLGFSRASSCAAGEKIAVQFVTDGPKIVTALVVLPLTRSIDVSEAVRDATTAE
jgi:hypothetical protein